MGFLDRFKSDREKELKDKSLVKGTTKENVAKEQPAIEELKKQGSTKPKKVSDKSSKKEIAKKTKILPEALGHVILHPLVTEKAAILASQGTYAFVVSTKANRIQVRDAVRALYGITPVNVNIQNVRGKKVRFGRLGGQRNSWKKAFVTLPEGKTIDVYEGA
ncbi:50S ribosomal protein L23 [Patescibacteria group bacterium]|nr:50S ribosomal protein L23 [Patescibacteria group bacterium]MBU1705856.1 50S ribosomal protein L23 [Patescibacteria group bacterium]